ncbi:putative acetyltransferase [Secundilactobacillus oryzae JCM 18671]|uniref:Putative acetyltransferase n=1 Tax=Secundilactobacillus oryzae JCM 18671 TaxID=1291743 RepID=A0A081BHG7_9LACO|nr:putative acetyltransferase [Secundilactobacillus oryzae JCM 18671]
MMRVAITIRSMKNEDQERLAAIYLSARQQSFKWVASPELADFARDSRGESVIVAVQDDIIVGFASMNRLLAFVHLLFIDPEWQHQGVGHQLIQELEKRAKRPLTLKCVTENKAALAFYEHEGFKLLRENRFATPANNTLIKPKTSDAS